MADGIGVKLPKSKTPTSNDHPSPTEASTWRVSAVRPPYDGCASGVGVRRRRSSSHWLPDPGSRRRVRRVAHRPDAWGDQGMQVKRHTNMKKFALVLVLLTSVAAVGARARDSLVRFDGGI